MAIPNDARVVMYLVIEGETGASTTMILLAPRFAVIAAGLCL